MSKFRKKPVVVEAVQFTGDNASEILRLMPKDKKSTLVVSSSPGGNGRLSRTSLHVMTLEGLMKVSPGDWVIRGVAGELYPCKPDIFAATYEPADAVCAICGKAGKEGLITIHMSGHRECLRTRLDGEKPTEKRIYKQVPKGYYAVEHDTYDCGDCAFRSGSCTSVPPCSREGRDDGLKVIFKRDDSSPRAAAPHVKKEIRKGKSAEKRIYKQVPPGYYAVPASHDHSCYSINGEKCAFLSDVGCNRRACIASERDDRLSVIFKKEE